MIMDDHIKPEKTKICTKLCGITLLPPWPANSLDPNIIENAMTRYRGAGGGPHFFSKVLWQ